jgi:signal-transduction protein with cAMP-binding, CBS, and nucleotidyltransferase domain
MGYAHRICRARNAANHGGARTIFLEGDKTENGRFRLKANLLLLITETLQVLAISRGVTRTNSNDRAKALTQHHYMQIEVGQLGEDVAFALHFYCVSKLPISPIVKHKPRPLIFAF